jgi:hypothetical protein
MNYSNLSTDLSEFESITYFPENDLDEELVFGSGDPFGYGDDYGDDFGDGNGDGYGEGWYGEGYGEGDRDPYQNGSEN